MKLLILTSNSIRHKYFANSLGQEVDKSLVVSECKNLDSSELNPDLSPAVADHFLQRYQTEQKVFRHHDCFRINSLPILKGELNSEYVFQVIKKFAPDVAMVFGSSIIQEKLIKLIKPGRFINLHLGLSPYYRGSGTNFWPFVNRELEYVGSTIHHIDPGVDTGDIITHVRPTFTKQDNVHTIGCQVIKKSVEKLKEILAMVEAGQDLPRTKQWQVDNEKYYRNKDFNEQILIKYYQNLQDGLLEKYSANKKTNFRLVSLNS